MLRKASLSWRKARVFVTATALAPCVAACTAAASTQHAPEPGDQAVAKVNGQTVWASDVKREAVAEGLIGPGDPLDVSSDRFRQVLDEVIDTKVLAAEALARRLDKDPLAQRPLVAARERAREDIMVDSVVGKAVAQQAENALYQEFLKNRTPAEVIHLRQIVTASEPDAEAVKKQLATGIAFEAVAMERSVDPASRFKGGDLGEMTTDTLPQPLGAAVKDAKVGQVVGPVKVDAGWAILQVDDRHPETPPSLDRGAPAADPLHHLRPDQGPGADAAQQGQDPEPAAAAARHAGRADRARVRAVMAAPSNAPAPAANAAPAKPTR